MLAITSDSFAGYGLDHIFELVTAANLDGIEVSIQHRQFDTYDQKYLTQLSKRHNLPIVSLSTPANMDALKARRAIEVANAVGASTLSLTPPDIFNFNYKLWLRHEFASLQRKKKITLALVNPPVQNLLGILPKYAFNNLQELKEFPSLAFDICNIVGHTEPLLEIYSILKSNIRHIYLGNVKHEQKYALLADGYLPLESLLTRLKRDKYKENLILKFAPAKLGVGNLDKLLGNLENAKKFVEKYFN